MLDRTPFAWLRERDVDLLVCAELHVDGALRAFFADKAQIAGAKFNGAWVSHAELDGESDLIVAWDGPQGSVVALIENKIAAEFQPDQALRYSQRAARWAATETIDRVTSVLFAPSDYLSRPGSEAFQVKASYEDAAEALEASKDPRSSFLASALLAGISSYRRGYVAVPDELVSGMWQQLWEQTARLAPALRFRRPGDKPGRSTWIYFREAEGCNDPKQAVLVWKAERGQVDLQFRSRSAADLEKACMHLLRPNMSVVTAGKSASIRMEVPPIDFSGDTYGQRSAIEAGITASEQLRQYYAANRADLIGPGNM
jgi:hypothetical protein